jgi:hypothetical protein
MLDQMSMPVVFVVVFVALGVVALGILVVTRIAGERARSTQEPPPPKGPPQE